MAQNKLIHKLSNNPTFWDNLQYDLPAGIAVFLVTVPLSLGIALASGAPLFSGLITGVIGALVVAPLSGSALGISGTAAGLALIVLPAMESLGINAFLLAAIIAGIIQIIMGLLKAGVIAYYFPSSVINGMLSGIGIIIFLKQIPHAMGYDQDYEGDFSFDQGDNYSSFSELLHMVDFVTPASVAIAVISLFILILWEQDFMRKHVIFREIQAPLVVVILGIIANQTLHNSAPDLALQDSHLVMIPVIQNFAGLLAQLHFPDFSQLGNSKIYWIGFELALVASLETLLAIEAVDKLDPYNRVTPTNRELIAQGIGNISSAMLGGLPLTQVIVRSSVNVQSGAKTKVSAIFSGILLVGAIFLIPQFLNQIPLASLAAILIVAGYKLIRPRIFIDLYKSGNYHFIPFIATILGLVFTNILFGILIGLTIALFSILLENFKSAYYFKESQIGNKTIIRLSEHVSFLNRANLQQTLESLPNGCEVVIDASRSKYIDYDIYEIIQKFKVEAEQKKINLVLENVRGYGCLEPVEFIRSYDSDFQHSLTPDKVLEMLQEGNKRFVYNLKSNRNLLEQINDTSDGQFPLAIILSCMDSRTSVELIFDLGLGDVFSTRIAGNIVNDDILGSMEYACKLAGSKLIVVLGHSHCGAIKGACDDAKLDHLTGLLAKIKPAIAHVEHEKSADHKIDKDEFVQKVADNNVKLTVEQIRQRSKVLVDLEQTGAIKIVGGMYDIETGKVQFFMPVSN